MTSRRKFLELTATGMILTAFCRPNHLDNLLLNTDIKLTDEALRIHRSSLIVDGHNDLIYKMHTEGFKSFDKFDLRESHSNYQTDIPKLLKSGIGAQFWAVNGARSGASGGISGYDYCREEIGMIKQMAEKYPDVFEIAFSADDIQLSHKNGKIASLIGIEGATALTGKADALSSFYKLGARYITLCWSLSNDFIDSAAGKELHGGLSDKGRKLVEEMNRIGMIIDISHASSKAMSDVLEVSKSPIIASHSSCYSLSRSQRNLPDNILEGIAKNDGMVMVCFFPLYLINEPEEIEKEFKECLHRIEMDPNLDGFKIEAMFKKWSETYPVLKCPIERVVDHIDHVVKIAGIDHVGLGSDFDGIPCTPNQLEDVSFYPYITQALINRGYSETAIHKILGNNFLRVFNKVQDLAIN